MNADYYKSDYAKDHLVDGGTFGNFLIDVLLSIISGPSKSPGTFLGGRVVSCNEVE
jgi:hypothetical protein